MKRMVLLATSSVTVLGMAIIPALPAQATSSQIGIIHTTWNYQYGTAVSPNNNLQALTDFTNDDVYFIDKQQQSPVQIMDQFATFGAPMGVVFSPDGTKAFVANFGADISVIDVASESVIDEIMTTSSENQYVGVSPDGTKLVVTDRSPGISVFDLTNPSYPQIGSRQRLSNLGLGMYFRDNSTAYVIGRDGNVDVVDINSATVVSSYGSNSFSFSGTCSMPDMSSIVIPQFSSIEWIDPTTGERIASLDLTAEGAEAMTYCSVTTGGYIVITDRTRASGGVLYIVDGNTHKFVETLSLTGVTHSDGVNVMGSDCQVFVDGYDGNVAIVQLDTSYCVTSAPELPNTGNDAVGMGLATAGGFTLFALGAFSIVLVRRRASR